MRAPWGRVLGRSQRTDKETGPSLETGETFITSPCLSAPVDPRGVPQLRAESFVDMVQTGSASRPDRTTGPRPVGRAALVLLTLSLVLLVPAAAAQSAPEWVREGTVIDYEGETRDADDRVTNSWTYSVRIDSVTEQSVSFTLTGTGGVPVPTGTYVMDPATRRYTDAPDADIVGTYSELWIPPVDVGDRVSVYDQVFTVAEPTRIGDFVFTTLRIDGTSGGARTSWVLLYFRGDPQVDRLHAVERLDVEGQGWSGNAITDFQPAAGSGGSGGEDPGPNPASSGIDGSTLAIVGIVAVAALGGFVYLAKRKGAASGYVHAGPAVSGAGVQPQGTSATGFGGGAGAGAVPGPAAQGPPPAPYPGAVATGGFCRQCGRPRLAGHKFCTGCGAHV